MPGERAIRRLLRATVAAALLCAATASADDAPKEEFKVVADVPLPGDSSRFDYASIDPERHLLFIAHLGASEVLAFDTQSRKVVARIKNVRHVHGVLAIPELHRVYASATGTGEVVAIDADSLTISARIPGGQYPDGMAFALKQQKLFVSDEKGEAETIIDAGTNKRVATIELGGEAGNTQYDSDSGHIFVNVQTRNDLVEIDPETDRIIRRIPVPGALGNHGLLLQSMQHRAFIACEGNDKLVVLNLQDLNVEGSFSLGGGPDVLAEDPSTGRIYVASESGIVSVFASEPGKVRKTFEDYLGPNAHVVAIDAVAHLAYFPLRSTQDGPALRIVRTAR